MKTRVARIAAAAALALAGTVAYLVVDTGPGAARATSDDEVTDLIELIRTTAPFHDVDRALEAGWAVLSDDLVVLAPDGAGISLFGVHRDPAIPMELGGPVVERGTPLDGPRQRALLDRTVLTTGAVDLAGTIMVTHAADADGTLTPASARRIVPLLLKSFAPTVDDTLRPPFFAFTERVVALPAWELGHAADVAQRRAHVARALTQCAP